MSIKQRLLLSMYWNIYKKGIFVITRCKTYKAEEHDGKFSPYSNKIEEIIAMEMQRQGMTFDSIGKIIDYQTPLKSKKDDVACCVLFKNKYYLPVSSKNIKRYFRNKTDSMVIEAFDGSFYANIFDIICDYLCRSSFGIIQS